VFLIILVLDNPVFGMIAKAKVKNQVEPIPNTEHLKVNQGEFTLNRVLGVECSLSQ